MRGSIVGCIGIVVVVFFVGLCGILAAWGGQIQELTVGDAYFATDYNLYFLAVSLLRRACCDLPGTRAGCASVCRPALRVGSP